MIWQRKKITTDRASRTRLRKYPLRHFERSSQFCDIDVEQRKKPITKPGQAMYLFCDVVHQLDLLYDNTIPRNNKKFLDRKGKIYVKRFVS